MDDCIECPHNETKSFWGWTDLLKRFGYKKHKLWREVCTECREDVREWHDAECVVCLGDCP